MPFFSQYVGKKIDFFITGDGKHSGFLVDFGPDIIVVFEKTKFLYVPLHHVGHLTLSPPSESNYSDAAPPSRSNGEEVSYPSILSNAKGLFCEIVLADHQTMHGYIVGVHTDYFTVVTPLNKTILIPYFHLKWLSPYAYNATPYSLSREKFDTLKSSNSPFAPTFEEKMKQLEGSIVALNEGLISSSIGLLKKFENKILELVTADEKLHYYHIQHVKNVYIR